MIHFWSYLSLAQTSHTSQDTPAQVLTSTLSRLGYGPNQVICKKGPESSGKLWKKPLFEKKGLKTNWVEKIFTSRAPARPRPNLNMSSALLARAVQLCTLQMLVAQLF